jgi:hypothetical protein
MQVWALGRGFAVALRKFNRFVDTQVVPQAGVIAS